jgi:hypothetical protein
MLGGKARLACSRWKQIQEPDSQAWNNLKIQTVKRGYESVGIGLEKDCAVEAQKELWSTDPTYSQGVSPTSTNLHRSKYNSKERKEKELSTIPDGGLTPAVCPTDR